MRAFSGSLTKLETRKPCPSLMQLHQSLYAKESNKPSGRSGGTRSSACHFISPLFTSKQILGDSPLMSFDFLSIFCWSFQAYLSETLAACALSTFASAPKLTEAHSFFWRFRHHIDWFWDPDPRSDLTWFDPLLVILMSPSSLAPSTPSYLVDQNQRCKRILSNPPYCLPRTVTQYTA